MIKKEEKIKVGWTIPEQVKDDFVTFCARKGTLAQEDCASALVVWQHLPATLREWAKAVAKGEKPCIPEFWYKTLPAAIEAAITPECLSDEVLDRAAAAAAAKADSQSKSQAGPRHRRAKHDS